MHLSFDKAYDNYMKRFKSSVLDKETLSPERIAKLHKVPVHSIVRQLKLGIEVEKEHTTNPEVAREIALDHLKEDPEYYSKIKSLGL